MASISKEHLEELFPSLKDIQDTELREKIYLIWNEVLGRGNWEKLEDIKMSVPLYMINFVKHTNSTTQSAVAMAKVISEVHGYEINYDYLIAIANLHDVSKVLENDPAPESEKGLKHSELGDYFQHGLLGGYYAEKYGLPTAISAGIVCHAGNNTTLPRNLETIIVTYADLADADAHRLTFGGKLHLSKIKKV